MASLFRVAAQRRLSRYGQRRVLPPSRGAKCRARRQDCQRESHLRPVPSEHGMPAPTPLKQWSPMESGEAFPDEFAMLGVYCASKISRPAPSPSRRPRNTPAPASPSTPTAPASSARTCGSPSMNGSPKSPGHPRARPTSNSSAESPSAARKPQQAVAAFVSYLAGPDSDYMTGQAASTGA